MLAPQRHLRRGHIKNERLAHGSRSLVGDPPPFAGLWMGNDDQPFLIGTVRKVVDAMNAGPVISTLEG
eukprot:6664043-Prymnesium_polylepis.2